MRLAGDWQDKKRGLRGVACSEARLLGPYLKANGKITAETGRRAAAARRGWSQCGRFWKAKVPRRVKRPMCISSVQWSSLSGLTSYDAGATTLRSLGPCVAWDVVEPVRGELRVKRGEEPDRKKENTSFVLGHCCR